MALSRLPAVTSSTRQGGDDGGGVGGVGEQGQHARMQSPLGAEKPAADRHAEYNRPLVDLQRSPTGQAGVGRFGEAALEKGADLFNPRESKDCHVRR
jgi:hypothetical protein